MNDEENKTSVDATADTLCNLTNAAAQHIYEICGGNMNLMLAVSNAVSHRTEMQYRVSFGSVLADAKNNEQ